MNRQGNTFSIMKILLALLLFAFAKCEKTTDHIPMVINTWAFSNATARAWNSIATGGSALDAVEIGCKTCEELQCDGTVGYGGGIDEHGETTLDAMIMDGKTLNVGAVAGLRRVKKAISVARHVLQFTKHSLLVGDLATEFASQMGFKEEPLSTEASIDYFHDWSVSNCQPNFWVNVLPDPRRHCGPYSPFEVDKNENDINYFNSLNHDTIGMIAVDVNNNVAAGTSTNGAKHKIPGRVGDSPIPGAGAYADNDVGAAVATGDGDIMLRLLPSFLAVEQMRLGRSPTEAATYAIKRIIKKYQSFFGGVVAVNKLGEYGAACHGMEQFPFSFRNTKVGRTLVSHVNCV